MKVTGLGQYSANDRNGVPACGIATVTLARSERLGPSRGQGLDDAIEDATGHEPAMAARPQSEERVLDLGALPAEPA